MKIIFGCSNSLISYFEANSSNLEEFVLISDDGFLLSEINALELLGCKVFLSWNNISSEKDFLTAENLVRAELLVLRGDILYFTFYTRRLKYYKTLLAVEKIFDLYGRDVECFFLDSIGFSSHFFVQKGIKYLGKINLVTRTKFFLEDLLTYNRSLLYLFKLLSNVKRKLFSFHGNVKVFIFSYEGEVFCFIGGLKKLWNSRIKVVYEGEIGISDLYSKLLELKELFNVHYFAQEAHCFMYGIDKLSKVYIIFDGVQPPNYTMSYFDMYPSNVVYSGYLESQQLFCEQNNLPFDYKLSFLFPREWQDQVLQVYRPFDLIEPEVCQKKFTVVLLLQSSSEWASMTNRSDSTTITNYLIKCVERFSEMTLLIRLHPSMDYPSHDGIFAKERYYDLVKYLNRDNIFISENSLQDDVNIGDFFFTDYSSSIFKVMLEGKIWISINLTSRRNFFEFLSDYNFLVFDGEECLDQSLQELFYGVTLKLQYGSAVKRYISSGEFLFLN